MLNMIRLWRYNTVADPAFADKEGTKDYVYAAHIPSAKREVPYCRGPGF